ASAVRANGADPHLPEGPQEEPAHDGHVTLDPLLVDPDLVHRVGVNVVEVDLPGVVLGVQLVHAGAGAEGPHRHRAEAAYRWQPREARGGHLPRVEAHSQAEGDPVAMDVRRLEVLLREPWERDVELDRVDVEEPLDVRVASPDRQVRRM